MRKHFDHNRFLYTFRPRKFTVNIRKNRGFSVHFFQDYFSTGSGLGSGVLRRQLAGVQILEIFDLKRQSDIDFERTQKVWFKYCSRFDSEGISQRA